MNGRVCKLSSRDKVVVEVTTGTSKVPVTLHITDDGTKGAGHVSFTVQLAGTYHVSVMINGSHIKGSPFLKTFSPGK